MYGQGRYENHVYIQRCRPETKTPSGEGGALLCCEGEVASEVACKGQNVVGAGGGEVQTTNLMWRSLVILGKRTNILHVFFHGGL
jgi:hypothetical protein